MASWHTYPVFGARICAQYAIVSLCAMVKGSSYVLDHARYRKLSSLHKQFAEPPLVTHDTNMADGVRLDISFSFTHSVALWELGRNARHILRVTRPRLSAVAASATLPTFGVRDDTLSDEAEERHEDSQPMDTLIDEDSQPIDTAEDSVSKLLPHAFDDVDDVTVLD